MRRRKTSPAKSVDGASIDSLQRGLDALRCFRPGDEVLGAGEIAQRLAIPEQTVLRLLSTLEEAGFLRRFGTGSSFSLHGECQFIGQAFLSTSSLARKARPILQTLADRFGAHVLLCIPEQRSLMILVYAFGHTLKPLRLGVGSMLPVASTAFGHAWLWKQGATTLGEWVSRLRQSRSETGGNPEVAKIYSSFQQLEDGGVCMTSNDWREGFSTMATPLYFENDASGAIGCLTSVSDLDDPTRRELGAAVRDAADRVREVFLRD